MYETYNNPTYVGRTNNCYIEPKAPNKPYELTNDLGEVIGYYWYYGESIDLVLSIDGEVTDETSSTYIPAADFVNGKKIKFTLYNFRHEEIFTKTVEASTEVKVEIDSQLSQTICRGNYYGEFTLFDITTNIVLIPQEKLSISIK